MKKIHCHDATSISVPPIIGATIGPIKMTTAKMPWPAPTSSLGKRSRRDAWAVAIRPPPNSPCSTRKTMSWRIDIEKPHSIDATVKPITVAVKY